MVQVSLTRREGLLFAATPDYVSRNEFEVLARSLARWEPVDEAGRLIAKKATDARAGQEFLDVWGIQDARTWDPTPLWDALTPASRLVVPLGKAAVGGRVVWLDLKEGAEGGKGPHGMLIGQTGSGKSKHLRALVLSLAMKHPPEMLQILLGDFKGEAEFTGLEALPHCVGVVSNLEASAHKLDRFREVTEGEMVIRQEMLKSAGFESVRDYEAARAAGATLDPIGQLVIILDEFSELLKIKPEMAEVFDRVGRLGRSLWVSILNASQRAETGKMAGLIAQQTYAIGMKVRDQGESRRAIQTPLAYDELKNAPSGSAILAVDGEYTKYRSFFTKAPFQPPRKRTQERAVIEGYTVDVHRFESDVAPLPDDVEDIEDAAQLEEQQDTEVPGVEAPTVESVLVDQIVKFGKGRLRRTMWLPALDDTPEISLEELGREFWGRQFDEVVADGGLVVPVAREDNPRKHTQDVVCLNLSGAGGNVGIAGETGSGKSMAVQTLMLALAASHSPQRVQFYGIDFGGGTLSANMEGLPHVAGIAGRGDEERLGQVITEVEQLLRFRERHWNLQRLGVAEFRARKFGTAVGEVPDDAHGDVFLVVDGIRALQNFSPDLHQRVVHLSDSALNYAIHLVIANDGWGTINQTLEGRLGSRIELRLAQAVESKSIDKDAAKKVPRQPGRGVQQNGLHMRVGAPYRQRAEFNAESEAQATKDAVEAIAQAWVRHGVEKARPLRMLPGHVAYDDLAPAAAGMLKLGMGQNTLDMVGLDITKVPHFYAAGHSGSGRSTLLRTLLRSITEAFPPPDRDAPSFDQAQIVLFESDYNVIDSLDERYKGMYAVGPAEVAKACEDLAQAAVRRRAPSELSDTEKRLWRPSGPRWFIVVDDLNLLSMGGGLGNQSALQPLTKAIERGRTIGVHVLAATTAERFYQTGTSNKVIAAMDTAGASVLIMDSDPKEAYVDKIKGAPRVPGRGELVTRKEGRQLVQVAMTAPPDGGPGAL